MLWCDSLTLYGRPRRAAWQFQEKIPTDPTGSPLLHQALEPLFSDCLRPGQIWIRFLKKIVWIVPESDPGVQWIFSRDFLHHLKVFWSEIQPPLSTLCEVFSRIQPVHWIRF